MKTVTSTLLDGSKSVENLSLVDGNMFSREIGRADALGLIPSRDYSERVDWDSIYTNPPERLKEWVDLGLMSQARTFPIEGEFCYSSGDAFYNNTIPFFSKTQNKYFPRLFRLMDPSNFLDEMNKVGGIKMIENTIWGSPCGSPVDDESYRNKEMFYLLGNLNLNLNNGQKEILETIDGKHEWGTWAKRAYEYIFGASVEGMDSYGARREIKRALSFMNKVDVSDYHLEDVEPGEIRGEVPRGAVLAFRDAKESGLFQKVRFAELVKWREKEKIDPVLLGEFYGWDYPICYWEGD